MPIILTAILAVGLGQARTVPTTSLRPARIPKLQAAASGLAGGKRIAVYGSNTTLSLLAATPGYEPVVVSDAQVATPGFLDKFDALFYSRDGTVVSYPMSDAAVENVRRFVTGNVALFATDMADKIGPGAPDGEDPLANRAFLNALAYATASGSGKGFVGELTGTYEALGPRLNLLPGRSISLSGNNGAGLYQPFRATQPSNPIVGHLPERWISKAGMDWIVATEGLPAANILAVGPAGGGVVGTEYPTIIIGQVSGRRSSVTLTIGAFETPQNTQIQATVYLDAAARADTQVQLISNTSAVSIPKSVTVPKGKAEASFWVRTKSVTQSVDAAITAFRGTNTYTAYLRVLPVIATQILKATVLRDPINGSRIVNGIVCDNLPSTPPQQRSRLRLESSWKGNPREVYAYLYPSLASPDPAFSAPHLGQISLEPEGVTYFPPLEFNENATPSTLKDLTKSATRSVWVELLVRTDSGAWFKTLRTRVVLGRTPIVLVHGINSSGSNWNPFVAKLTQAGIRYPIARVDYHDPHSGRGAIENAAAILDDEIAETISAIRSGDSSSISPDFSSVKEFAIQRVDLVAWSYGGVVARWYLADRPGEDSYSWYLNMPAQVQRKPAPYDNDVRKLITIGSMWRGVPLTNIMNEINATASEEHRFGDAPVVLTEDVTIDDFIGSIGVLGNSAYPAWQVMGVESRWLRWILGNSGKGPFRDGVAYGSVAGDDSDYYVGTKYGIEGRINPYQGLIIGQKPSWFPYLNFEVASQLDLNYTDGLVPVWSAAIPGEQGRSYRIVEADHSQIPWNAEAMEYTLTMLNSTRMMTGQELQPHWNSGKVAARGDRYQWTFDRPDRMAPSPQNRVYDQVGGVGRLNVAAVREFNSLRLESADRKSITFTFHAAVAPNGGKAAVQYFANGIWNNKVIPWTSSQLIDGPQRVTMPVHGMTRGLRIRLAYVIWERRIGSSIVQLKTTESNEVRVP